MTTDKEIDLLQIKIEKAKENLPAETLNAINAVDWKAVILSLREKKGYSFEQLGNLETETELLLCGLITPAQYPKELQSRMSISKAETDNLVNEMNILVFKKIKEELIKNTERRNMVEKEKIEEIEVFEDAGIKIVEPLNTPLNTVNINKDLNTNQVNPIIKEKEVESREEILKKVESPEGHSILADKLSTTVQMQATTTEHVLENTPKDPASLIKPVVVKEESNKKVGYKVDPYRLSPDE